MIKLPFLKSQKHIPQQEPVVLLVLDGFGIAPASPGNAITLADTPNLDQITSYFPNSRLIAAGESVGLPANENGNSEVGHLTIGAGRVINQSLVRIDESIKDGSFLLNKAFLSAVDHVIKNRSKMHIMGLASSGSVHSSINHLYALLDFCKKKKLEEVYLHLFTDGRDAPVKDGLKVVKGLEGALEQEGIGKIASVAGRYFAMDRDRHWDRIKMVYDALVLAKGERAVSASQAIETSYSRGETDEFVKPTLVVPPGQQPSVIGSNDAVIFFNFRIDRPRQLTMAFVLDDFENLKNFKFGHVPHEWSLRNKTKKDEHNPTFTREKRPTNLFFVTMTEYQKGLPVTDIAFPPPVVMNTLTEVISKRSLFQMHMAESEKERMVTFYFDGLREEAFPNEEVEIVASPRIATYDKKPEMSAKKLTKKFKKVLSRGRHKFFVLNFANPDMVAHSGNLEATKKAINVVDKSVGEIVKATLAFSGTVFITADHGNAEELLTYPGASFYFTSSQGSLNTEHSNNPVPFMVINNQFQGKPKALMNGSLKDVAPTILHLMGISVPPEMTGQNLLASSR